MSRYSTFVYALAWDRCRARAGLRAVKSSDPVLFMETFISGVNEFRRPSGEFIHPGCEEAAYPCESSLQTAALIEARAAARALSAVLHRAWCPCAPCVIRRSS